MPRNRVIHASWSLLAAVSVLTTFACGEPSAPPSTEVTDAQIEAALQATNGFCVPTEFFSDGLGELNPLAQVDRLTALDECGDPTPDEDPNPKTPGIWLYGWDQAACFKTFWDPDADGVNNACENALAVAFAPALIMAHDCDWDYTPGLDRMGGEYYFAVQQSPGQVYGQLRIAYLPAYYLDCGVRHDFLSGCTAIGGLGIGWCEGHSGDSEFILVDVSYDVLSSHWVTDHVFLSAHCGEPVTGYNCQWYSTASFQWRDGHRQGAPKVWVAEGKHSDYRTQDMCNSGALGMDECSYNTAEQVFPIVYGQQNVGSRSVPLRDCGPAFSGSPETSSGGYECTWTKPFPYDRFNGWQWERPSLPIRLRHRPPDSLV